MQKALIAILLALPLAGCQDSRPPRNYPPPASFQTRAERLDPYGPQAGYERRREWRMTNRAQANLAVSGPRAVPAWNDKTLSSSARYPSAELGPDIGPALPPPQGHDAYLGDAPREFRRRGERRALARADGPRAMLQRGRPSEDIEEPTIDFPPQSARTDDEPTDTPALPRRGRSSEEFEEPMADFPRRDARYARDSEETGYTAETAGRNARYARDSEEEDWRFGQAPGQGFRGGSRFAELPPGFQTMTLTHGGRERSYLIYAPPELQTKRQNRQPVPLVLVFHGGGGNAAGIARTTNLHRVAEREGFIAVYPNGTSAQGGRRLSWNAGASPPQGYAEKQNVDDVGFVRTLLRQVQQTYPIDARRIYATGFSKGGMLTYRLACEMADQLAAIAPVGGTLTYAQCQPARPVALLHIHGSNDQSVPFAGGRGADSARMARYPSVLQNLDRWRQRNHCDAKPAQARVTADTERYTYQDCKSGGDVSYYLVRDGGHAWPGSELKPRQQARGIRTSQQLKASEEIWNFFARHAKP
ncbi:MAG: dienelactone hydrolase family protein [Candidatus Competibacteraceae bacterium]|nr:dienelactone hydrolase family protein [Candidatus Competibacteraceae bacterium]